MLTRKFSEQKFVLTPKCLEAKYTLNVKFAYRSYWDLSKRNNRKKIVLLVFPYWDLSKQRENAMITRI